MCACGTVPERFTGWETAGVPFIADDLGAWLTGLLADAGRRKLTALVLGTDQEQALRSAATAAVQRTAEELRSDDGEQAAQLALVISQGALIEASRPLRSLLLQPDLKGQVAGLVVG
jgi:hypothetical protein